MDTKNILFICGGAFEGIEKIIERRMDSSSIGFGANIQKRQDKGKGELLKKIIPADLVKFGIIPELVGRLPVISTLEDLTEEQLVRVLTEPKNSLLRQYSGLFQLDDVELVIDEEALQAVAREAIKRKTGARGLRNIMEEILLNLMFVVPSDDSISKVVITPDVVDGSGTAKVLRRKQPLKKAK